MRSLRYFFLVLLLAYQSPPGYGQSPYRLSSPGEYILSGSAFGFSVTGFLLSQHKAPFTAEKIVQLKKEDVSAFDRSAISHFSSHAKNTSDVLLYASLASPFVLLLDQNVRENSLQTGLLYFETLLVASVGVNISKGLVRRARPYVYNPEAALSLKQKTDATNSFFSGHTAMSAASSFFAAKVFCDYNPSSKLKPAVWIGAAALPLATGYCRYRAGQHFFSDILVGYCWGALTGIIIPQLHLHNKSSNGS